MAETMITSVGGVRLAVREHGSMDGPTLIAVHGYPDNQSLWDGVIAALPEPFRVVTYDVRGAGRSSRPRHRAAYRLDELAKDLQTVIGSVSAGRPVHLLAHDWGSIQTWHAVTRLPLPVASYTSISGPCLDYAHEWMRLRRHRPTLRGVRELLRQSAMSSYIPILRLPRLPEQLWRAGVLPRLIAVLDRLPTSMEFTVDDGVHGLALYRANMGTGEHAEPRHTSIPVQVLAPAADPFVSTPLQADIGRWVTELRVRRVPGGHWLPRTQPELVARYVADFIHATGRG